MRGVETDTHWEVRQTVDHLPFVAIETDHASLTHSPVGSEYGCAIAGRSFYGAPLRPIGRLVIGHSVSPANANVARAITRDADSLIQREGKRLQRRLCHTLDGAHGQGACPAIRQRPASRRSSDPSSYLRSYRSWPPSLQECVNLPLARHHLHALQSRYVIRFGYDAINLSQLRERRR